MFDKIKQGQQLLKMRNEAMALQKQLKGVTSKKEKDTDTFAIVSGDRSMVALRIDGVDRPDIVNLVNDALKDVQNKAAKKMMEASGGLGGLLGKLS